MVPRKGIVTPPPPPPSPPPAPPPSAPDSTFTITRPSQTFLTTARAFAPTGPTPGIAVPAAPLPYIGTAVPAESLPFTTSLDQLLGGDDLPADVFSWRKTVVEERTKAMISNAILSGRPINRNITGIKTVFHTTYKLVGEILAEHANALARFTNPHAKALVLELRYASEMFKSMGEVYREAHGGREIDPHGRASLTMGAYITSGATAAFSAGGSAAVAGGVTSVLAGGSFYAGAAAAAGIAVAAFPAAVIAAGTALVIAAAADIVDSLRNPFASREFTDAPEYPAPERSPGVGFGSRAISVYYGRVLARAITMANNRIYRRVYR